MDTANNIPDPTDWLKTPLASLSALESALHCQICKEFYDTPMTTSCSHTFCSRCIRTSLSADGKCPACRASDQASKLRNNWAVEEVVGAFLTARPDVLGLARKEVEDSTKSQGTANGERRIKRKRVLDSDNVVEGETVGRGARRKSRRIAASQSSNAEDAIGIVDSEDEEFQPKNEIEDEEPDDGLVACPLGCGKRMKEEAVFSHLDRCEDEQKEEARKAKARAKPPLSNGRGTRNARRPEDRISELSYSMMKDNALRKKLNEVGIPNWGSKQLMVRRHTEWVNLWNANCDSNSPRTKRDLLHDLDTWERTQGGRASHGGISKASALMEKDFDGAKWANKNKDDFSRLIADARRKTTSQAENSPQPDNDSKGDNDRPFRKFSEPVMSDDEGNSPHFPSHPLTTQPSPPPTNEPTSNAPPDPKPYENNEAALSSIRAKVAAANHKEPIKPLMNAGFERPETSTQPPPTPTQTSPHTTSNQPPAKTTSRTTTPAPKEGTHASLIGQAHFGLTSPSQPETDPIKNNTNNNTDSPRAHEPTRHLEPHHPVPIANAHDECSLPTHYHQRASRKVPMFVVPRDPVCDLDGGAGNGGVAGGAGVGE